MSITIKHIPPSSRAEDYSRELKEIESLNVEISDVKDDPWTPYTERIHERLPLPSSHVFVAYDNDSMVGYLACYKKDGNINITKRLSDKMDSAYCSWIAVAPNAQGKGIGKKLLLRALKICSVLHADVRKVNTASLRLFASMHKKGYEIEVVQYKHQYRLTLQNPFRDLNHCPVM